MNNEKDNKLNKKVILIGTIVSILLVAAVGFAYFSGAVVNTNNWLKPVDGWSWMLSPDSLNSYFAFVIYYIGFLSSTGTYNEQSVHPVVYLKSDVSTSSGAGTESNPYILA